LQKKRYVEIPNGNRLHCGCEKNGAKKDQQRTHMRDMERGAIPFQKGKMVGSQGKKLGEKTEPPPWKGGVKTGKQKNPFRGEKKTQIERGHDWVTIENVFPPRN